MDFDSPDPDVEKEFPGLFASANQKKDEDDFSEGGDHESKVSKKELLLLGRRKEKKDKKDRGYATLDGESSEEDFETNPSKSAKKSKTFKFTSSRSKEKREKSRDKEKSEKESKERDKKLEKESKEREKKSEKDKDKEKKSEKERDSDSKDKKKDKKEKHKEKKEKKVKQTSSNTISDILELGVAQPIFGVSLGLAVVRGHCHDNVNLPLIVRDCIDYLQEHGLQSEQIYKVDVVKTKLQQLKQVYNNRETVPTSEFDIPTACSLLKLFIHELPEPLLTTDLLPRFEEVATGQVASQTAQIQELGVLINQLPSCNRTLLMWLLLHFDSVIKNEKTNKMNIQTLAMLLGPTLQMSHRLLVTMLTHCSVLFPGVVLTKYKPPITSASTSPNLPETPDQIHEELKKQESLLSQIHSEMNAGFVSKKREEQLWEVQRIITQLKRKLRSFERSQDSMQKSIDDGIGDVDTSLSYEGTAQLIKTKSICSDDESLKTLTIVSTESNTETKTSPQDAPDQGPSSETTRSRSEKSHTHDDASTSATETDKITVNENGLLMLPESHPEYLNLIRLQLENHELNQWKQKLQRRIQSERTEVTRLKSILNARQTTNSMPSNSDTMNSLPDGSNYERVVAQYVLENTMLEQKKNFLAKEIFDENQKLIQLQVELAVRQFQI
ncbi:ralA-binding protein 1 isoform X2 [Sitodiplosis mosellana]|uniref:ralA-binding protein 1 isoform X2 n=1 Tax=Sitodiplosis mosellana TaxID=263140 RepID=UPI0024452CD6|nr:ralA-binding protein 1 isoform X2 [Sitodiplosis mosellana]